LDHENVATGDANTPTTASLNVFLRTRFPPIRSAM